MKPFKVAALQMVSTPRVAGNIAVAGELIAQAAMLGAKLVVLPEYFGIMGLKDTDKIAVREADGSGPLQGFLAGAAAKHGVWVVGGSIPLECAVPGKVLNTTLVYDDSGRRVARYDKIHLFGFEAGKERYDESATIAPGCTPVALDTPFGRLGLSICYDLRFPEVYRALHADLIVVPAAFTATTGRAHWELLLRARAVENLAWVVAAAQGGVHENGRETFGHSMVVDPWGGVLACQARGAGVVIAEIDPAVQKKMRTSLPALQHRVM
ncbi:MAG: carbon-nitrogen hydrolase family protein [Betaproteobacteria bacterium]